MGVLSAAEGHTLVSVSKLGSKDTSKVGNSGLNFPFRIKDIQAGSPPRLLPGGPFSPIAVCPGEAHPKLPSLPWLGRANKGQGMSWDVLADPFKSASAQPPAPSEALGFWLKGSQQKLPGP